jgi:hypothetical protein
LQLEQNIRNKMSAKQAAATPVSLAFVNETQWIISRTKTTNTNIYEHPEVLKIVPKKRVPSSVVTFLNR